MSAFKYRNPETGKFDSIPCFVGPRGEQGPAGPTGPQGPQGPAGKDAGPAPAYIAAEAERVATSVRSHQNANTFSFLATSDLHLCTDTTLIESVRNNMLSFLSDIKYTTELIRSMVTLDFETDLGDKVFGATAYGNEDTSHEGMIVNKYLAGNVVRIDCLGNHDTYNNTVDQRFAMTGIRNKGAVYGSRIHGYGYRDIEEMNTRVIFLNTSERTDPGLSGSIAMSDEQLIWLCGVLEELAEKPEYHILFLSHMPPDWGLPSSSHTLLAILEAYEMGESITMRNQTYDFSNSDRADVIAWIHGHLHNHKFRTVSGTNIWRICVPCGLYSRANEYSKKSNYPDETFQELFGNETISKDDYVIGTAASTAFSVFTVDLGSGRIYVTNCGAGGAAKDRVIVYRGEKGSYSVTSRLTDVSTDNPAVSIDEGAAYCAVLTAAEGYEIDAVTVTMGGTDITSSAYKGGRINISSVSGDLVITASAGEETVEPEQPADPDEPEVPDAPVNYTNLVPTMRATDSTEPFNGCGYQNGSYASGAGVGTDAECVLTGLLPYDYTGGIRTPIYIKGCTLDMSESHVRIIGFKSEKHASFQLAMGSAVTTYFDVETLGTDYYRVTPLDSIGTATDAEVRYFRFSLVGTGENLIITLGEPIE